MNIYVNRDSCCRSADIDLNTSAKQLKLSLPFCVTISLLLFAPAYYSNVYAEVLIKDANLTVGKVVKGLEDPIAMSFINSGEISGEGRGQGNEGCKWPYLT